MAVVDSAIEQTKPRLQTPSLNGMKEEGPGEGEAIRFVSGRKTARLSLTGEGCADIDIVSGGSIAAGDILHGEENPLQLVLRRLQAAGVEQHGLAADAGEVVLNAEVLEG